MSIKVSAKIEVPAATHAGELKFNGPPRKKNLNIFILELWISFKDLTPHIFNNTSGFFYYY